MREEIRPTRRRLAVLATLGVMAWLAAPGLAFAQTPAPVRAELARSDSWRDTERVTGSLRAVSRADVASQEEGLVLAIHADEGDRVSRGDLLVELDARRLRDSLEEARASERLAVAVLREREADAARAEADRARFEQLFEQDVASDRTRTQAVTEADAAVARVAAARRSLEAARARVSLLETRFADARIVAPFDGVVVGRGVEPGEWVEPGTSLLTVVSDARLEAWLDVPERHAVELAAAQAPIELEVAGQPVRSSDVRRVPEVDPRARTFPVVATIDNADGRFASGMSVTAWVPKGAAERRVTVPRDAVVQRAGERFVYRIERDGAGSEQLSVRAVAVSVLGEQGDRVAVEGGIRSGDAVVTEGNARLADGDRVVLGASDAGLARLGRLGGDETLVATGAAAR